MTTIFSYRLPPHIERGARGGPDFHTLVQEAISGRERRIAQWSKARRLFDISYGLLDADDPLADYNAILSVFLAHQGKMYPFRFKDWSDYQAVDEVFGIGVGFATTFQLKKTYDPQQVLLGTPGTLTYTRNIVLPTVVTSIKLNGAEQDPEHYAVDLETGIFIPEDPAGVGQVLSWSGEFDVPVRFDSDHLPAVILDDAVMKVASIALREVLAET